MMDPDDFAGGEEDAAGALAPPIEAMGARYGISVAQPGRGGHEPLVDSYLMPSVAGRHGSMEKVDPSIVQTPLGGMVPGPDAIAPAVMAGEVGAFPVRDIGFGSGVVDGYPEGCPVPVR